MATRINTSFCSEEIISLRDALAHALDHHAYKCTKCARPAQTADGRAVDCAQVGKYKALDRHLARMQKSS